jgi:PIN domain nuclease of toxin-antitoxin system
MNLLLDTHALLWWLADDPSLSREARAAVAAPNNLVYVSAATAWEISIKRAFGKLEAPNDLDAALAHCGFQALPITVPHATAAGQLPPHHSDPFDRMLVAQASLERLTLVTRDPYMPRYGVDVLRA